MSAVLVGLALLLQPFQADEWYRFLPSTGRNADPAGVFKLVDGQLHVLDIPVTNDFQEFGYVATTRDYSNYHLRLRYRWGDKRFVPRASEKRDSGVLYHVVGPDLIWPRSVECQIQEGDTGDIFLVDGTGATTTVSPVPTPGERQFAEGGVAYTQVDGRIVKSATVDSLTDWNTVEVIVTGAEAVHIVNDTLVARVSNMTQPDPVDPTRRVPPDLRPRPAPGRGRRDRVLGSCAHRRVHRSARRAAARGDKRSGRHLTKNLPRLRRRAHRPAVSRTSGPCMSSSWSRPRRPVRPSRTAATPAADLQERYALQVSTRLRPFTGEMPTTLALCMALADAARKRLHARPALWQSYEVTFRAARFLWRHQNRKRPRQLSFWNGVPLKPTSVVRPHRRWLPRDHLIQASLLFQDHGHPVRYRNLWIQPLRQMSRPFEFGIAFQSNKTPSDYLALGQLVDSYDFDVVSVYNDLFFQPALGPLLYLAQHVRRARMGPRR